MPPPPQLSDDPLATKLALAQEFNTIGDSDGARTLIEEGMPAGAVFAAAFGAEQPVASNTDAGGRSKNRRVEMAPVPKSTNANTAP